MGAKIRVQIFWHRRFIVMARPVVSGHLNEHGAVSGGPDKPGHDE
jgi:hypothetical protein